MSARIGYTPETTALAQKQNARNKAKDSKSDATFAILFNYLAHKQIDVHFTIITHDTHHPVLKPCFNLIKLLLA